MFNDQKSLELVQWIASAWRCDSCIVILWGNCDYQTYVCLFTHGLRLFLKGSDKIMDRFLQRETFLLKVQHERIIHKFMSWE